jgi:hypothetical protein
VWLVRGLVALTCALAAAWLAGASGIGTATQVATLCSCGSVVALQFWENPGFGQRRVARQIAIRVTLSLAAVLAAAIVLPIAFR